MSNKMFLLQNPEMTDVQVSQALGLNRMPTYGGLYQDQYMIGSVEEGILEIKEEFINPDLIDLIIAIAKPLD